MIFKAKKFILVFCILVIYFCVFAQENAEKETTEQIPQYEHILDASNALHLFSYKDENLEKLVLHALDDKAEHVVTYNSGSKLSRFFYSKDFELERVEKWNIGKKVSESSLLTVTYYNDSNGKVKSTYGNFAYDYQTQEFDIENNFLVESFFSQEGFLLEKNTYSIIGVDEENKLKVGGKNPKLDFPTRRENSFLYSYDSNNQIVQEEEIQLEYRTPQALRFFKQSSRKMVYQYNGEDFPSVTMFYEDNILRMRTVYKSQNDYTQYIYFSANSYVVVQYEKSQKISEQFFVEGE